MESRALEEHLNLGRLVLTLAVTFAILEGPYVIMTFVVDVRNVKLQEIINMYDGAGQKQHGATAAVR
jgi:hypothetical protein